MILKKVLEEYWIRKRTVIIDIFFLTSFTVHQLDFNVLILFSTFQKLTNLQSLNLAYNNLWSLPKDSLCDLVNLRKLNVSHNHILDVLDLGLENCEMPEFRKLDFSHNHLTTWRSGSAFR